MVKASFARAAAAALLVVMAVSGTAAARDPGSVDRDALLRELGAGRTAIDRETGNVRFVSGSQASPAAPRQRLGVRATPSATARAFVERYASVFGVRDAARDLRLVRSVTGARGTTTVRFSQQQAGVPVIGAELLVQVSADGSVIAAAGEATDSLAPAAQPALTAAQAAERARAVVARDGTAAGAIITGAPELAIFDPALVGAPGRAGARLVWRLSVVDARGTVDEQVIVDATSGAIALRYSQREHAFDARVCRATSNRPKYPCAGAAPDRTTTSGPSANAEVNAAFEASRNLYDFFWLRFGRDSIDGAGMPLVSTVNSCGFGCASPNAFWDGALADAQAVFTPGMAVDDVVAHEFVHGFTEYTSGLLYYHQSGAINEALSDIFGELVDITNGSADDNATTRWQLAEGSTAGVIRDMEQPPSLGQPDRTQSNLFWADEEDGWGVHVNSGVPNKAASLMADGGTFNGQAVSAIGVNRTAAIWYRAATAYLWSASDFADLGAGLQQACTDLSGSRARDGSGAPAELIDAATCAAVAKAVLATEMASQPTKPGAVAPAAPACISGSLADVFLDHFDGGLGAWNASSTRWSLSSLYTDGPGTSLWGRTPSGAALSTVTRDLGVLPADAVVTFRHAHILDHFAGLYYDGGAVEISVNGGAWTDGEGLITHNGYNGVVLGYAGGGNPLAGRRAFVGWSAGYITSRLDLSNLAGQSVRLRFVTGTDQDVSDYGWFIDDVRLFSCAGATDATPPLVSVPNANLRSGVQVGGTRPIKLSMAFDATDVAGVQSTRLERRTNNGAYASVALGAASATAVDLDYVTSATARRQLRAAATDSRGNASGWLTAAPFKVLAVQNGSAAIVQSGTGWRTQSKAGFYGGSVRHTRTSNARQKLTRTMSDVAIVTTLGPNRGKFDVYIDGQYRATVDAYAPTLRQRQVAFAWDFGSAGTHTIELRVLGAKNPASAGTRVDLDAFLVLAP